MKTIVAAIFAAAALSVASAASAPAEAAQHTCFGMSEIDPLFTPQRVRITDRFDSRRVTVEPRGSLCFPAQGTGGSRVVCYIVADPWTGTEPYRFRTRYGTFTATARGGTNEPRRLCVGADYAMCYQTLLGAVNPRTITVADRFGSRQGQLYTPPFLLCVSAARGVSAQTAESRVDGRTAACFFFYDSLSVDERFRVRSPFGRHRARVLKTGGPILLCVPAKFVPL
jgi:hypothetical protein